MQIANIAIVLQKCELWKQKQFTLWFYLAYVYMMESYELCLVFRDYGGSNVYFFIYLEHNKSNKDIEHFAKQS